MLPNEKFLCCYSFGIIFLWAIINSIFLQSIWELPSHAVMPLSLIVVFHALVVMSKMLNVPIPTPLWKQSKFWLCSAIVIYHSSTFFHWCIYNYHHNHIIMNRVNLVMCWIFYAALTYSIWLNRNENKLQFSEISIFTN